MFPAALSGIVAAIVLGISRAVGETMIVAIAGGNLAQLTGRPARRGADDDGVHRPDRQRRRTAGSPVYNTLFAVGALLFVLTLLINVISIRLVRKFREVY